MAPGAETDEAHIGNSVECKSQRTICGPYPVYKERQFSDSNDAKLSTSSRELRIQYQHTEYMQRGWAEVAPRVTEVADTD